MGKNTMMSKRHSFSIILLGFVALTFFSCKNKKNIATETTPRPPLDSTAAHCKFDFKNAKALSEKLKLSELDFNTVSAKFNCELTMDKDDHSFNVGVRCRKDSVIWMSISKLGIEAARVLITKDSVKIRLDLGRNEYFAGDFTYINSLLHADLDFNMIQALLFGNSAEFHDDDERLKAGRDKENCQYILGTIRKRKIKKISEGTKDPKESYQTMRIDPESFKILRMDFEDVETRRKFNALYKDFQQVDQYLAPFKLIYSIVAEKTIKAEIDFSKIKRNEELTYPFKIPSSYKPIIIEQRDTTQGK